MAKPDRLIDANAVAGMYHIAFHCVRLWVSKGIIPKPVLHDGKIARWSFNEVQAHIKKMKDDERREQIM